MISSYEFVSCFKYRNSSDGPLCTFYSLIKYEIILGGNPTGRDRVFILQKKRLLKLLVALDLEIYVEMYLRN